MNREARPTRLPAVSSSSGAGHWKRQCKPLFAISDGPGAVVAVATGAASQASGRYYGSQFDNTLAVTSAWAGSLVGRCRRK